MKEAKAENDTVVSQQVLTEHPVPVSQYTGVYITAPPGDKAEVG